MRSPGCLDSLPDRISTVRMLSRQILSQMQREVVNLGFSDQEVSLRGAEEAQYRLEKDPATSEQTLVGDWLDSQGHKRGSLLFHADGSFFVEQDVIRPHPSRPHWFVEAIHAWGRDETIKVEAQLLPMPE